MINVETVAVVRSEYGGQTELDVPGVTEHGHDVGQGQVQLFPADRGEAGPAQVTAEAPLIHRSRVGQLGISEGSELYNRYCSLMIVYQPFKSLLASLRFKCFTRKLYTFIHY